MKNHIKKSSNFSNRLSTNSAYKGFRVIMKNRFNHEPCISRCITQIVTEEKEDANKQNVVQNSKTHLKQYIKNMKKPMIEDKEQVLSQVSKRSIHLKYSTRSQNKSVYTNSIQPILGINQLQTKLEDIIQLKLSKLSNYKNSVHRKPFLHFLAPANELQNELKTLMKQIKQLKVKQVKKGSLNDKQLISQQEISQEANIINRKIHMLEKVIAQSSNQSEMLKKYYYAIRSQKKSSSLINNKNFTLYKSAGLLQNLSTIYMKDQIKSKPISYQTTNNFSYRKPSKKDYKKDYQNKSTFKINRQPMARSTYSCQYLTYGILPNYSYKENHSTVKNHFSGNIESAYKSDFKAHQSQQKCNIKDQDCCQDKFRNPNINFINSYKNNKVINKKNMKELQSAKLSNRKSMKQLHDILQKRNSEDNNQSANLTKSNFHNAVNSEIMTNFNKKAFISEAKKSYIQMHGNPSLIKDKALNILKNAYKNCLKA